MKKIAIVMVVLFLGDFSVQAQNLDRFFNKTEAFFKANVINGKVAYDAIKKDQTALNEVLKIAEGISVQKGAAANYQAFWINAYNLSVIKGIVDNYPINSPLDHKGFFDKTTYNLGGMAVTLNAIENKLLRENFKDPRFHFVLVCGALGCPPLISKAYLPDTLELQLETQTRLALNGRFLKVDTANKKVEGSELLKWYKTDFTRNGLTEIDFINTYRTKKIPTDYTLTYFTYNWSLNKQK
ncbi:DUF547 domain-containing protein [Lacinutrix sp. Hel_I_90]|uniref:DUF547 domain-containing protein n=1 Tax=Lacinutrix sp. Hel_I_90 TaxID=1249999 RepID=UPI0005CB4C58|nr:DUF547 domain-containing protein [Lacinutrix sp. Hel_I_90]